MSRFVAFLAILSLVYAVSCGSARVMATTEQDSVRVVVAERLVELQDTVKVDIPLVFERAIAQDSSNLENDYARSKAVILPGGKLSHTLETIPQTIFQPIVSSHTIRDSVIFHGKMLTRTVEVERELTAWQRFRLNGFWVVFALLLVRWR